MVNHVDDMGKILQSCLEKIQGGQDELAPILSGYPEKADELRPVLEIAVWLWSFRTVFDPHPDFLSVSRRRLISMIQ